MSRKDEHGGKRPNAGRPSQIKKVVGEAKELTKQLQSMVKAGLWLASEEFQGLIQDELQVAKGAKSFVNVGTKEKPKMVEVADERLRMQARHYLLDMVQKVIQIKDVSESPAVQIINSIRMEREKNGEVAGEVIHGHFTELDGTGDGGADSS